MTPNTIKYLPYGHIVAEITTEGGKRLRVSASRSPGGQFVPYAVRPIEDKKAATT